MLIPGVFPHYKIDVKLTLAAVRFNCKEPRKVGLTESLSTVQIRVSFYTYFTKKRVRFMTICFCHSAAVKRPLTSKIFCWIFITLYTSGCYSSGPF